MSDDELIAQRRRQLVEEALAHIRRQQDTVVALVAEAAGDDSSSTRRQEAFELADKLANVIAGLNDAAVALVRERIRVIWSMEDLSLAKLAERVNRSKTRIDQMVRDFTGRRPRRPVEPVEPDSPSEPQVQGAAT